LRPSDRPVGRTVAGPVRRGEVITDVRLLGPALVSASGSGQVAAPVRVADAASVRLVRTGDVVDVLAATPDPESGGSTADLVASRVRVIAVPQPGGGGLDGDLEGGALVVLATTSETASRLAAAAVTSRLSLTLTAG
jgi:Flp pilus assembly protein CpaB